MTVFMAQGWMRLAATMPGLGARGLRMERPGAVGQRATNAGATGGRSKCVSGRQSARTRRYVDKSDNSWGHAASRKVHSRAERRRFPASRGDPDGLIHPKDRVPCQGHTDLCFGRGATAVDQQFVAPLAR